MGAILWVNEAPSVLKPELTGRRTNPILYFFQHRCARRSTPLHKYGDPHTQSQTTDCHSTDVIGFAQLHRCRSQGDKTIHTDAHHSASPDSQKHFPGLRQQTLDTVAKNTPIIQYNSRLDITIQPHVSSWLMIRGLWQVTGSSDSSLPRPNTQAVNVRSPWLGLHTNGTMWKAKNPDLIFCQTIREPLWLRYRVSSCMGGSNY